MFKLFVFVFAMIFALAMAAPEAKPQYLYSGVYPYPYGISPAAYTSYYGGYVPIV
ncbi:hypothetical protein FQR65_LT07164 [Abscondita terminalis]|nr:hypothetical protein FQR65_LT07164 [Abscondita terminalis]